MNFNDHNVAYKLAVSLGTHSDKSSEIEELRRLYFAVEDTYDDAIRRISTHPYFPKLVAYAIADELEK